MLIEKLNDFKEVIKKAKDKSVDIQSNEFIVYLSILNNLEGEEKIFTDEQIMELVDRIVDINLDIDEYTHCSVAEIVDFCIENYDIIDDMSNTDILEDIIC